MSQRQAVVFESRGVPLVGVIEVPSAPRSTALLVVTGGPQYRVGSHRQFALLCRALAAHDIAAMTFDFRGSGDSGGVRASFEDIGPDIQAAINKLCATIPSVRRVAILGLCDAASAALMSVGSDARVAGLLLLNPWVRSEGSLERARVEDYYPDKLASGLFWKRLLSGKINIIKSLVSFFQHLATARQSGQAAVQAQPDFLRQMLNGVREFSGELQIVLSGQDMTAQEFRGLLESSSEWREATKNVRQHEIPAANHTFASAQWRDEVSCLCVAFVNRIDSSNE